MQVTVTLRGDKEFAQLVRNIGENVDTMGLDISKRMAEFMQRSARMRSQRWKWTGQMEYGINTFFDKNKVVVEASSPATLYQELGFGGHWVHESMPTKEGGTIGDWVRSRGLERKTPFLFVKKKINEGGYFIGPAIEAANANFEKIAQKTILKAMVQGVKKL